MNFLEGVNRVLRSNGILKGDDDDLASFNETQHSATVSLAKISIEDALGSLVSNNFIPFEEAVGEITLVNNTRLYTLPTDFVRFQGPRDHLVMHRITSMVADNHYIPHIEEEFLRRNFPDYRERTGEVLQFYIPRGTTKQVGFWYVPNSNEDGKVYRYYYEKDVSVTVEADDLPFHNTLEANIFIRMASRYFTILYQQVGKPNANDPSVFELDPVLTSLRAQLLDTLRPYAPNRKYMY